MEKLGHHKLTLKFGADTKILDYFFVFFLLPIKRRNSQRGVLILKCAFFEYQTMHPTSPVISNLQQHIFVTRNCLCLMSMKYITVIFIDILRKLNKIWCFCFEVQRRLPGRTFRTASVNTNATLLTKKSIFLNIQTFTK